MTEMTTAEERAQGRWRWTFVSGCLTLLLALLAFLLPEIEQMPKGELVGWVLMVAGVAELIFGLARGSDPVGAAAAGSGLLTGAAGLLFIANPLMPYFPVVTLVMIWLFLRGAFIFIMALGLHGSQAARWLGLSGLTDILLGFAVLSGLHISVLVVMLFGPTREIVAMFALVLATSFFVTGISQLAIARLDRKGEAAKQV